METHTNKIVGNNIPSGRYADQRWLVAHNAWNTNQNPWNNQCKTITELLDYGVRGFALDVYGDDVDSLHLQHGHGNAATAIKWSIIRDELKTWMDAHPDEIVSLFFESYLEGPEKNNRIPESPTTLSALQESLGAMDYYVAGKENQETALSQKKLSELVTDNQRLFAFLEKEPDEGRQDMFPIMARRFAENVYGDDSLKPSSWCNLRDGSNRSHSWRFMNHFGNAPTDSSKSRNADKLLIKHAEDFLFNFHGHYPNFISLDKINCETGDNGPATAIQKLRLQKDVQSSGFKFPGNTFDDVHPEMGEQPIISFMVKTAKGQGITEFLSVRGGPDFESVNGIQLINVPGHGIVNMRFKNGKGDWGKWLTEFETTADDKKNQATYEVPAGNQMTGFCYRISDGYGAVDLAIAYRPV